MQVCVSHLLTSRHKIGNEQYHLFLQLTNALSSTDCTVQSTNVFNHGIHQRRISWCCCLLWHLCTLRRVHFCMDVCKSACLACSPRTTKLEMSNIIYFYNLHMHISFLIWDCTPVLSRNNITICSRLNLFNNDIQQHPTSTCTLFSKFSQFDDARSLNTASVFRFCFIFLHSTAIPPVPIVHGKRHARFPHT